MVTLDGVVQYPNTQSTTRAYSTTDNTITFTSAPAAGVIIQVRHIGFAGAASNEVTAFYGRTGNVQLKNTDNVAVNNLTVAGNLDVTGDITYDETVARNLNITGIATVASGIVSTGDFKIGTATTLSQDNIFTTGIITATSFVGSGANLTGVASTENIRTNTNATFLQNVSVVGTSTVTGNIVPSSDSATDIGTNSVRFQNAYVDTYYGDGSNLTGISADVVDDTSPQLGGDLQSNGHDIKIADTSGYDGNNIYMGSDNDMRIHHDGSNFEMSNSTGTIYLRTDSAIHIQKQNGTTKIAEFNADADCELYHNGTKQCETSANGLAFPAGKGIDFSAASGSAAGATASVLDDYEEGTFSPTLRGNNTNSTGPITGQGKYTRVGRMVYVIISFQNKPSTDLPSGEYIQIHGLPFTVSGHTQLAGPGMNYKIAFNASHMYYWYIPQGGTICWGYYNVNVNSYQPWGTDQWRQTSSNIYHENSFVYEAD